MFLAFLTITSILFASSISVIPHVKELSLDRPRTVTYIVSNTGNEHVRIRIKPVYKPLSIASQKK